MSIRERRIFIREFSLLVSIGIHDFERKAPQRVVFNIEVVLAGPGGDADDDIARVLDYDEIRTRVRTLAAGRHFNLQETLCQEILEALQSLPGVARIRLSTEKPDVYADCAAVGYALDWVAEDDA
ncbi:MAG TPA: dihydroneopterin aldolase [Alphaproteobacteria bacterium]|nr:dihydroneopterin aldolase [Alphaproteobacteria bacterium]